MRCLMTMVVVFAALLLSACDTQVPQTVIVRANVSNATLESLWLVQADQCAGERIMPGWYRDGLWIFRLSSTRGGVGTVTQELALCYQGAEPSPITIWHSVHGGGAPLIVLSCDASVPSSCALYMEQHTEGAWDEPKK